MLDCTSPAAEISLRELLPRALFHSGPDIRVSACTSDSRACRPGDLFVAVCGQHYDGHDFARHAVARGAKAVLAERMLPVAGIPLCIVEDSRLAYGRICQALAGSPSRRVKVIAAAGTTGTRATSLLLNSVLRAADFECALLNSVVHDDGSSSAPRSESSHSTAQVATWLARAEKNGCSHAILELPSHAIHRWISAGIHFDAACVTDVHGERSRGCPRIKSRVLNQLGSRGLAVLNADDPACASYLETINSPVLSVAMEAEANISAVLVERCRSEQTFMLTAGSDAIPVRTKIIGDEHIYSCLAAAAVGLAYGIELTRVVAAIEAVECIAGRLERMECGQRFGVFVDSPTGTIELGRTLSTIRAVTPGRLICVSSDCDELAGVVRSHADVTFESRKSGRCDVIRRAVETARTDDCVLVLSSADGGASSLAGDRQLVQHALSERAGHDDTARHLYRYMTISTC